jgi:hypothetical protein
MSNSETYPSTYTSNTLPFNGLNAVYVQAIFISSALVLPIIAHVLHAPIRYVLPMHWPVILAGLLYGWRAGAITGVLAPLMSYLLSGLPLSNILPSMTAELFAYGFFAGIFRQKFNINSFASIGASIVIGRIVFVVFVIVTNRASISDMEYFKGALLPGLVAAIIQIISLPFLSNFIITKYLKDEKM